MNIIDFTSTEDTAFDHLMHDVNVEVQATNDIILPDEMVMNAVNRACGFFQMPEVPVINADQTCVWNGEPGTPFDDVFGFSRHQLMEMGIKGEDSLTMVFSHECAHRTLQGYGNLDPWEHELACDYFAGIHAGMNNIDTDNFKDSLCDTGGSMTHPTGKLRADFIEYGILIARELKDRGIPVTFDNCLERFNVHLIDIDSMIAQYRTSEKAISFTAQNEGTYGLVYSKEEISKMKNEVEHAEYELSCRKNDVSNWESKVSLNNTKEHKENGDYAHVVSRLNNAKSKYNDAVDELNSAKSKLRAVL